MLFKIAQENDLSTPPVVGTLYFTQSGGIGCFFQMQFYLLLKSKCGLI